MENSQGNSFIPKSPVRATTKPRTVRRVFILTYITFVFFFGTLIAAVGIFVWGITIEKQLDAQKNDLAEQRVLFDQADLERVREFETRMNIAYTILDRQVSVRSIFKALERATLRTVQVTGFEYSKDESDSLKVSMSLSTADFNSSLSQKEIFQGDSVLAGSDISEVGFTNQILLEGENSSAETEVQYIVSKTLTTDDIPYVPQEQVDYFSEQVSFEEDTLLEFQDEITDSVATDEIVIDENSEVVQDTNQ